MGFPANIPESKSFFMIEANNNLPSEFRRLGKPIDNGYAGRRIDFYLGKEFLFRSRTNWQGVIDAGKVLVNGRSVKPSYMLSTGDEVCYFRPVSSEPEVNKNISVIWEKDGLIAIHKPSNLPMHEGGAYRKNTFCEVLKDAFGPEWAPTHRLDRETSGIVLCSDKSALRTELSGDFYHKRISKRYVAFANGEGPEDQWDVNQPIVETKNTSFRIKYWVEPGGLPSQTHFRVKERIPGFTYLEVSPRTGRTHQIRVHSAWSGLHLVGDKKYFPDESIYLEYYDKGFSERVRQACHFDRLCLHAAYLSFTHPGDKKRYEVECEVPEDMKQIWASLKSR